MVMQATVPFSLVESINVFEVLIYQTTRHHISEDNNLELNSKLGNHFLLILLDWVTPLIFGEDYKL